MKYLLSIIIFSLLSWQSCIAKVDDELEAARSRWIEAFNSRSDDVQALYIKNSGLFSEDQFLFGKEKIAQHLLQSTAMIDSAQVIKIFKANRKRYFEIGIYRARDSEEKTIHYVTIWLKSKRSKDQPRWLRELDVMYVQEGEHAGSDTLDFARAQWNKLANKRSALRLMNALYAENAVYINKREVHNGRPSIVREYSSYIDLGYAVRLRLKHGVVVQPDLAIDIGKYTADGGSGGNYVQVWKQQPDKSWRVIFEAD